jgi:hypothetical protein
LDETDQQDSRDRDDGRLAYHQQRFVIDGNERGVVPPDGKRYGIEAG